LAMSANTFIPHSALALLNSWLIMALILYIVALIELSQFWQEWIFSGEIMTLFRNMSMN